MICFEFSCVTPIGDTRPEGVVVERNKKSRPVWADSPTNSLTSSQDDQKLHFTKERQRDLPIAIKLTQSESIEASYIPWKVQFDQKLRNLAKFEQISKKYNQMDFAENVHQLARKYHAQLAQVEDIYYEKIRIDDATKVPELKGVGEYYDVHVLVSLKLIEDLKLKSLAKSHFLNSKWPELKKWAQELK
ncbi:MAG: hypothetical protein NT027_03355 [Proteobacteria bacterium]|nr:hypothetical protein [Pseudomonadota bacterium]